MKILIIEDEALAVERIKSLLLKLDKDLEFLADLDSVESSIEWLQNNPEPDLIMMDIQLADGMSFSIFDKVEINTPVIFTTAFNEYAIKAFKHNSVDYLLKPIKEVDLQKSLEKYKKIFRKENKTELASPALNPKVIQEVLSLMNDSYKKRFVVKRGQSLQAIPIDKILYFFSENKITWLKTSEGKKYAVDYNLDNLLKLINPAKYFRINRKYIISFASIKNTFTYSNSRLKIELLHENDEEPILVSRDRVSDFKSWLDN